MAAAQTYFHQMLITLGGWAQYARYQRWQAELGGTTDTTITDFLAIRLIWEEALFDRYEHQIGARWQSVVAKHALPVKRLPTMLLTPSCRRPWNARRKGGWLKRLQRKARRSQKPGLRYRPPFVSMCGRRFSGERWNTSTLRSRPWGSRASLA